MWPEGDQTAGVVWKPDGQYWWLGANTVSDVYCYTCQPGKALTADGRCVDPCALDTEVRLEDSTCKPANSCPEGNILNGKGACVQKCKAGYRAGDDGQCRQVQHPRSRPFAQPVLPSDPFAAD